MWGSEGKNQAPAFQLEKTEETPAQQLESLQNGTRPSNLLCPNQTSWNRAKPFAFSGRGILFSTKKLVLTRYRLRLSDKTFLLPSWVSLGSKSH